MESLTGTTLAAISNSSIFTICGAVISCSLIIASAALSISKIGSSAVKSVARQPEAGKQIFSAMVIAGALIEGITFFALLICFLALFWSK
jgi:F-type H+-transporting ATPase subunit c